MVLEHEIPEKSKLYFGETAKIKREIEYTASKILLENGFEEIVTPTFTYYQSEIINKKELIHLQDDNNCQMTLRADTTIDVARITTKRLGKQFNSSKIFYIQPVFSYPSTEQYQIGAEHIGEKNLSDILKVNLKIFQKLNLKPVLQISNIKIPKILSELLNIPIESFINFEFHKFRNLNLEWLNKLVALENVDEVNEILDLVPAELKPELVALKTIAEKLNYENLVLAPLYYTNNSYYNSLFFRMFDNNRVFAKGGQYRIDSKVQKIPKSVGFSIYTDQLIETFVDKK